MRGARMISCSTPSMRKRTRRSRSPGSRWMSEARSCTAWVMSRLTKRDDRRVLDDLGTVRARLVGAVAAAAWRVVRSSSSTSPRWCRSIAASTSGLVATTALTSRPVSRRAGRRRRRRWPGRPWRRAAGRPRSRSAARCAAGRPPRARARRPRVDGVVGEVDEAQPDLLRQRGDELALGRARRGRRAPGPRLRPSRRCSSTAPCSCSAVSSPPSSRMSPSCFTGRSRPEDGVAAPHGSRPRPIGRCAGEDRLRRRQPSQASAARIAAERRRPAGHEAHLRDGLVQQHRAPRRPRAAAQAAASAVGQGVVDDVEQDPGTAAAAGSQRVGGAGRQRADHDVGAAAATAGVGEPADAAVARRAARRPRAAARRGPARARAPAAPVAQLGQRRERRGRGRAAAQHHGAVGARGSPPPPARRRSRARRCWRRAAGRRAARPCWPPRSPPRAGSTSSSSGRTVCLSGIVSDSPAHSGPSPSRKPARPVGRDLDRVVRPVAARARRRPRGAARATGCARPGCRGRRPGAPAQ